MKRSTVFGTCRSGSINPANQASIKLLRILSSATLAALCPSLLISCTDRKDAQESASTSAVRVCRKEDGKHYGIAHDFKCQTPDREAKDRPTSLLGFGTGDQMNWDTAAAQSASKTEQMSKKKAALLKDIQDIDKTLEIIPGAELWGQAVSLYSQLKWSEYLVEHFKGSNKDVVSIKTRYQAANRLLEALPAEDFKRIKELDAKRFDLIDSWPTAELPAGINCEAYCLSLEPFKNHKSLLNAAKTARQESEAKGLSLKDTNSSIKKALYDAIKRQSGENKAKFSEPKPIKEFQFTTEEAKAQFKTWWNLSKMNHNMSDLSTEAGIIEKLEKDGFPVDEIKGDPQFRRRVATCYKTTGNAWSCQ